MWGKVYIHRMSLVGKIRLAGLRSPRVCSLLLGSYSGGGPKRDKWRRSHGQAKLDQTWEEQKGRLVLRWVSI